MRYVKRERKAKPVPPTVDYLKDHIVEVKASLALEQIRHEELLKIIPF